MNNYKRKYRQLDDEVKQRISASMKNKPKTAIHREHIKTGMERYWMSVPNRPRKPEV